MARKRRAASPPVDPIPIPSPIDDPPTASSSSDSEEEQQPPLSQPKEEEAVDKEQQASEEEDGDDEEDDEEDDDEEDQPPVSSQPSPAAFASANSQPKPKPSSTSSESGSETDDESESDDGAPLANNKVKPLASKPMIQKPKPKAQSSPAPARSGTKRAAVNNNNANDSKRAKKKPTDTAGAGSSDETEPEDDLKKSGEDSKKLFSRVWSAEDEITIVKGLIDFLSQTGNDPVKHNTVFYEHVRKSLNFDASCRQLTRKIRSLKEKFKANAKKGKNGEDPVFSKPHDKKLYELSKKFWGNEINEDEEKGKGKKQTNGKLLKSPKKEVLKKAPASVKKQPLAKKPAVESKEENGSTALLALKESGGKVEAGDSSSILSEMFRFDKSVGLSGLSEQVVKKGVELMGESEKAELEGRWKKLQVAELELFVKRADLIQYQARLILEAYKSSDH